MNNRFERLMFALAGALIVGAFSAYPIQWLMDESPERIELSENAVSEATDHTIVPSYRPVVYRMKKLVIGGWLDVINPYTTVTLATEPTQGGSNTSDQVEVSEDKQANPVEDATKANFVNVVSYFKHYIPKLPYYYATRGVNKGVLLTRCRGPGTAQNLMISNEIPERNADLLTDKFYNNAEENPT